MDLLDIGKGALMRLILLEEFGNTVMCCMRKHPTKLANLFLMFVNRFMYMKDLYEVGKTIELECSLTAN